MKNIIENKLQRPRRQTTIVIFSICWTIQLVNKFDQIIKVVNINIKVGIDFEVILKF